METKIEFRKVREATQTTYWHVEAYAEGSFFPVGTAYVMEVAGQVRLEFLFVADQWRRRGFGRALLEAVRDRWPDFRISSPLDAPCQAFADAVLGRRKGNSGEANGIAQGESRPPRSQRLD